MNLGEGKYIGRAVPNSVAMGRARSGSEQIAVAFEVQTDGGSETITWVGTFASERSIELVLKSLVAAGWDGVDFDRLDGLGSVDVELVLAMDSYDGGSRLKVKYINSISGGKFVFQQPLSASERKGLSTRVKAFMRSNATPSDDDIPF